MFTIYLNGLGIGHKNSPSTPFVKIQFSFLIFCKQYTSRLSTYIEEMLFCEMEPALSHWLNVIDILICLWQLFAYVLKEVFI